jgi:hypothetical protein
MLFFVLLILCYSERESKSLMDDRSVDNALKSVDQTIQDMETTIRNCLGPTCFDERPLNSAKFTVGLIGLPESGSNIFMGTTQPFLEEVVSSLFESSTHVPPYGKGRTHGWSRFTRLFISPIHQALHTLIKSGHSTKPDFLKLLDAQVIICQ